MPQGNAFEQVRTQDQKEHYILNGNLYAYTAETLRKAGTYAWGEKVLPLPIEKPYDLDIDTAYDLRVANAIADEFDLNWK